MRTLLTIVVLLAFVVVPAHGQVCTDCNNTGESICNTCKGDWVRVERQVTCKRTENTGCNGAGIARCNKCFGKGCKKCGVCNGSGSITTSRKRYNRYNRREWWIEKYTTDCHKCTRGQLPCTTCNNQGTVVCPRCLGEGSRTVKGKCIDCTKGKVPCKCGMKKQAGCKVCNATVDKWAGTINDSLTTINKFLPTTEIRKAKGKPALELRGVGDTSTLVFTSDKELHVFLNQLAVFLNMVGTNNE